MRIPPSFYYSMGRFLLFIAIEAICIVMASNNGIVQQYKIVGKIRDIQALFWEAGNNVKAYSKLKSVNRICCGSNPNTSINALIGPYKPKIPMNAYVFNNKLIHEGIMISINHNVLCFVFVNK